MAFDKGFDFRGTSGGATDPANCTYVLDSATDAYPVTRNGVTFGWNTAVGSVAASDRSGATDARLKGICYNSTTGNVAAFNIDTPASGTYYVWVALGDGEGGLNSPAFKLIFANGEQIGPVDESALGSAHWYGANATSYNEADWIANASAPSGASISILASTLINITFNSTSGFWGIAHLFVEQVVASTGYLLVAN